MRQFLKFFLASLLALIIFTVVGFFILAGAVGSLTAKKDVQVGEKAVLFIDLSKPIREQKQENPIADLSSEEQYDSPGLYDMIRLIKYAETDSSVKGIYLKCNDNPNGFATSEELRNALVDFKKTKKFVYAYGDMMSQKAYYIGNVADRVYCNPKGSLEWKGFAIQYMFFKNALDKLEIDPQIFYAGKFKSATEPFRAEKMTDANRLQSQELLNDLYQRFLVNTATQRNVDTASLHKLANDLAIQSTNDAVKYKLVDAGKYDDEVKAELKEKLGVKQENKINFVPIGKYEAAVNFKDGKGSDRIALIYAQGDIVDGKGGEGQIGGEKFRSYLRKVRYDNTVKAVVFRINSGGGSALASENIWREISLVRKVKPVILSFGDYAASGGYYLSCDADSIFAEPNTITGSIGVFSMMPNLSGFFKDKLGVTFDGVKTAEHAAVPSISQPLSDVERRFIQNDVDSIYFTFLTRVSDGRGLSFAYTDSIAQGRVWTGSKGKELGLVDRLGNIQDAVDCAARMAKLKEYRVKEYPEPVSFLDKVLSGFQKVTKTNTIKEDMIKEEVGEDGYRAYNGLKAIKAMMGVVQAKLPFEMIVE
jgi:protease-4